jgi:hypothetical protein
MDGGSGLILMYLDTFKGVGLIRDQLKSSPHPFDGVVPSKQSIPLGQSSLPLTLRDVSVDVSYAALQAHEIVKLAHHQEYSPGIVFIFSQGWKDLYLA